MSKSFGLEILHTDKNTGARYGILHTPHGDVETPMFMPVGTNATLKMLSPEQVAACGSGVVLANTYHLHIRPGEEIVKKAGGLHSFMNYQGPILTDSGGFQVFSLSSRRKITEDGVTFRNEIDGGKEFFSPEVAISIQEALGADIIMSFDECIPYPASREYVARSTERTYRWARRGLEAKTRDDQALFGIVQGGAYTDLRHHAAKQLAELPFEGYSIGGTSIGEPKEVCYQMIRDAVEYLPTDKPRYLMGVGSVDYILEGITHGIDMFDCVLPTRLARHGALLTRHGRLNIQRKEYEEDFTPIEEGCDCYTCQHYTKAYLRHLYKVGEGFGQTLNSIHNIRFLIRLCEEAREAIKNDTFAEFKEKIYADFNDPRGF